VTVEVQFELKCDSSLQWVWSPLESQSHYDSVGPCFLGIYNTQQMNYSAEMGVRCCHSEEGFWQRACLLHCQRMASSLTDQG
jgi:hypothetical protein